MLRQFYLLFKIFVHSLQILVIFLTSVNIVSLMEIICRKFMQIGTDTRAKLLSWMFKKVKK